jgi:hypothetical protein
MKKCPRVVSPVEFFSHLLWLDGRPLLEVIESYRQRLFTEALYSFEPDGTPRYNLVLSGRAKKNYKTTDLILAALYRFLVWQSPYGNDCFLLANDEGQAGDDLKLLKKLIAVNPLLTREVIVRQKEIVRADGKGVMQILPAKDIAGSHGKTYLFIGYDEIHGYRNWDLFEALAPDPTRLDALTWITSYASIYNSPGAPLYDLMAQGKRGEDQCMLFSWYAADFTTDPAFEGLEPEQKANPSMNSWGNPGYLASQRRRLPLHKYRRLHLNLPGMPEGAFFNADRVMSCIAPGRKRLPWVENARYCAFVDMSGGSNDDAALAISHYDEVRKVAVLDLVETQAGKAPFDPRQAVRKFAVLCKEYHVYSIIGDRYAGETFQCDFAEQGISYRVSALTKSQLYEALEPKINAGEVELLDLPKLQEQLLGLVAKGAKIDHLPGEHDDLINAAAGAIHEARGFVDFTEGMYGWGESTEFPTLIDTDDRGPYEHPTLYQ